MTTGTQAPIEPTEITAGRLHLRPPQPSDEDAIFEACQDPEIQRWTTVPSPYTREHSQTWLTRVVPGGWASGKETPFLVLDATTAELLACIGFHGIDGDNAEIGYWCAPQARGTGVMSEAVGILCRWGFGTLGFERIEWVAAVGNWPSRAVAQKCGFTIEGVTRKGMRQRGSRVDAWLGALLSTDEIRDLRPLPKPPALTDGVVTLRAWTVADAPDVVRACEDPDLARMLMPGPFTLPEAEKWLNGPVATGWATGTRATLATTDAATGQLLGCVTMTLGDRARGRGEIGYWTGPWARGRGVAARGAALLGGWALETLGLHRVELLADVDNHASHRVAEKAGYLREGIARTARIDRQRGPRDFVQYALTR